MISDVQYEKDYEGFKQDVKKIINIDLNQYKPAQMKRRIKSFAEKHGLDSLGKFIELLKKDEEILFSFKDFITINVTEFFRNPEKFEDLKTKILPQLIQNARKQGRQTLKIWSAGCSTGAEAYTIAIIMGENFPNMDYSILATDIDINIVKNAKLGEYRDLEVKNINKHIMDKYFELAGGKYKVKEVVKKNVKFLLSNLLEDTFNKGFDLILCRNVVIYFTEEAKEILYKKFYEALIEEGILFIGGTESILNARQLGFKSNSNLFYYK